MPNLLTGGLLAAAALLVLLLPKVGLLPQFLLARKAKDRERVEDALKHLLDRQQAGVRMRSDALDGAMRLGPAAGIGLRTRMESRGLIRSQGDGVVLTPEGQRLALQVLRAHRLWERYLASEARMPLNRVHRQAHRLEHSTDGTELAAMEASLGYPQTDPHGDPIPSPAGEFQSDPAAVPLTSLAAGTSGRVVHLEDEPPLAYAQIVAEGLKLGQTVTILEATPDRYLLTDGENELRLAPAVAANVHVAAAATPSQPAPDSVPLSRLADGRSAEVVAIDEACQGFTRRRFLDLGLTPGTPVRPELSNAFGDPRAYRIRGTLIALRRDQAALIHVRARSETP